jgi:very-short-patch-repair endonuclease
MRHRPPQLNRQRARAMRADATRPEEALWQMLKDRRLDGYKFRRQVPLKGFILDFVCFEARLIIEVDGWQHAQSPTDAVRDATFRAEGFRILRFWNDEVTDSPDDVWRAILGALRNTGE